VLSQRGGAEAGKDGEEIHDGLLMFHSLQQRKTKKSVCVDCLERGMLSGFAD
jgi:hypothetical protein